jgi:hypothetical protein
MTRIASTLSLWFLITERSVFAFVKPTGPNGSTTYIQQQDNGRVNVYTFDTERKDRKICQTPYSGTSGNYWTKLQGDGNFITYRGLYPSTATMVWKSNAVGASGTYKLDVKCNDTVAIYREGSTTPLWTCPKWAAPTRPQNNTLGDTLKKNTLGDTYS